MKVEYVNHMGDDMTVVNAARVSFDKESEHETVLLTQEEIDNPYSKVVKTEFKHNRALDNKPVYVCKKVKQKDEKLIHYLARHDHWTPFAHCIVQLRVTVPIFVANQLKRHQIGFALNEVSRRYVDDAPEFFVPEAWRSRPDKSIKQGSGTEVVDNFETPVEVDFDYFTSSPAVAYHRFISIAEGYYQQLIEEGVAPEMARMVLPQSMYTSWYWTGSLMAWARLCQQRLDNHAQLESQLVAKQIDDIIQPLFPVSWAALLEKAGA